MLGAVFIIGEHNTSSIGIVHICPQPPFVDSSRRVDQHLLYNRLLAMGDGANPMIPDADHMRIYQCVIPYFEMTRMHAGFCQVTTAEHAICRVWEKRNDGGKGRLVFERTVYSEDVKRITSTVFEAYRKIGRNKYVSCVQYHSLQFKWLWE